MSRRRRRPAAGAIPPVFDVVCTDRGQHRVTVLDMVVVAASTITEETLRWMAKRSQINYFCWFGRVVASPGAAVTV